MLEQDAENHKAAQALRKQVAELQRRPEDQATRNPEDIDVFGARWAAGS